MAAGPVGAFISLSGSVRQRCPIAETAFGRREIAVIDVATGEALAQQTTTADGQFMFRFPRDFDRRYGLRVRDDVEVLPDGEWQSFVAEATVPCDSDTEAKVGLLVQFFEPGTRRTIYGRDHGLESPDGNPNSADTQRERMRLYQPNGSGQRR